MFVPHPPHPCRRLHAASPPPLAQGVGLPRRGGWNRRGGRIWRGAPDPASCHRHTIVPWRLTIAVITGGQPPASGRQDPDGRVPDLARRVPDRHRRHLVHPAADVVTFDAGGQAVALFAQRPTLSQELAGVVGSDLAALGRMPCWRRPCGGRAVFGGLLGWRRGGGGRGVGVVAHWWRLPAVSPLP
ncbi:hypothetical protein OsI_26405 [Oryza sativa Indica Group]|uniref:Uncharacterized protein n=1 Tax=Oryza sativa subsp. indica TaxID=39946 RepID=B8B777_ORYSI|nr:hypothetical protein OsI_26405 [Oryza sativa Indica Group]